MKIETIDGRGDHRSPGVANRDDTRRIVNLFHHNTAVDDPDGICVLWQHDL
jgi:hypothetical protein